MGRGENIEKVRGRKERRGKVEIRKVKIILRFHGHWLVKRRI